MCYYTVCLYDAFGNKKNLEVPRQGCNSTLSLFFFKQLFMNKQKQKFLKRLTFDKVQWKPIEPIESPVRLNLLESG